MSSSSGAKPAGRFHRWSHAIGQRMLCWSNSASSVGQKSRGGDGVEPDRYARRATRRNIGERGSVIPEVLRQLNDSAINQKQKPFAPYGIVPHNRANGLSLGGRMSQVTTVRQASCRLSASPVAGGDRSETALAVSPGLEVGVERRAEENEPVGMHALQHSSVNGFLPPRGRT